MTPQAPPPQGEGDHANHGRGVSPPGPATAGRGTETTRLILRWLLIAIYLFAGIAHVRTPGFFMRIVPAWVPWPEQIVILTGLCEIAGAIGLIPPRLRRCAGIMLALYAVCVFPANIKHALDYAHTGRNALGWLYHVPRLAFQPVIVWWSLFAGGIITWPFRHPPSPLRGEGRGEGES